MITMGVRGDQVEPAERVLTRLARVDLDRTQVPKETPSHRSPVADQPATQWKSETWPTGGRSASSVSATVNGAWTAPVTSMAGAGGTTGGGVDPCVPKRGKPSTRRCPGGSVPRRDDA
jgi:hypothetical protein